MCENCNSIKKNNENMLLLIEKKIEFFKDVIQKTIIHVQENKILDILGISDVTHCIEILSELSKKIEDLINIKQNTVITGKLKSSITFKKFIIYWLWVDIKRF